MTAIIAFSFSLLAAAYFFKKKWQWSFIVSVIVAVVVLAPTLHAVNFTGY